MPSPADYDYTHAPTLRAFTKCDAFIRGLVGPLGGGKSSACVMEIAKRGMKQVPGRDGVRRTRWAVIRQSYRQLEDSTINTFLQWFPPITYGDWKPSIHTYTIRNLRASNNEPNAEIEVRFRALDRPDQVGNLLSTEYTGAWINEGRDVEWGIYEALIGRVGRYPAIRDGGPTWFGIFADTNPPDTDSKWYKFFEETDHSEAIEKLNAAIARLGLGVKPYTIDTYLRCFKQPSGLGPMAENLKNLPPGYYERQMVGKSEDWIRVYLHGEYGFTLEGKPVFPEYDDPAHCPDDASLPDDARRKLWPKTQSDRPIIRSYDFGLTPACIFSQVTTEGQWIIVDELVSFGMAFDEFSDIVIQHSNQFYHGAEFIDVGDPAGDHRAQTDLNTCFKIAWAKGIRMQAAPQEPYLRIESTRKQFLSRSKRGPKFWMHPRCVALRKALKGGYCYKRMQVTGERYQDKPDKNDHSHVADALTYAGAFLFSASLIEPQRGLTWEQPARIYDHTRSSVTGY